MSEVSFENFGHVAKKVGYGNIFISSSRYKFQEKFIPILLIIKKNIKIIKLIPKFTL